MNIFEMVLWQRSKVRFVWTLRQVFDTQLREAEAERSREETGSNRSSTGAEHGSPTTRGTFCRIMGACRTVRRTEDWGNWGMCRPEEPRSNHIFWSQLKDDL